MRLLKLEARDLAGVARFAQEFRETGINLLVGPNEGGKTTLVKGFQYLLTSPATSRTQELKDLQPLGKDDVGPEVVAEIKIGDHHLRVRKRWLRSPVCELTVIAPRQETLVGPRAQERLQELLEQYIDTDLWLALCIRQYGDPLELRPASNPRLASLLDAAAGGSLGGNRETDLLTRVEAERERFFDPHDRPKGDRVRLAAEIQGHKDHLEKAEARVQFLTQKADEEARFRREASRLRERLPGLEAKAQKWSQTLSEVSTAEKEVVGLSETVQLRQGEADRARSTKLERERLRTNLRGIEETLVGRQAVREEAERRWSEQEARLLEAQGQAATARESLRGASEEWQRKRADVQFVSQAFDLEQLQKRWDRLRALALEEDELHQKQRERAISKPELKRLQDLQGLLEAAESQRRQQAPVLLVRSKVPVHVRQGTGTHPSTRTMAVGEAQQIPVPELTVLSVPKVIEVEVRPGASLHELDEAAQVARKAFSDALSRTGVRGVEEALERFEEGAALRSRLERIPKEREQLLQTSDRLKFRDAKEMDETLSSLRRQGEGYLASRAKGDAIPSSREEAQKLEAVAAVAQRAAQNAFDEVEGQIASLTRDLERARETKEVAGRAHQECVAQRKALQPELQRQMEQEPEAALEARVRSTEQAAGGASVALETARSKLAQLDPETTRQAHRTAQEALEGARQELHEKERAQGEAHGALLNPNDDQLMEEAQRDAVAVQRLEEERRSVERKAAAVDMLWKVLSEERTHAHEQYAQPLRSELERLGRVVFGPTFAVNLDQDLRVARRTWLKEVGLPFDSLSTGAKEQMEVLFRLACARLVDRQEGVPLFLDDALGRSDPERVAAMNQVLALVARESQLFVLTSDRERYREIGDVTLVEVPQSTSGRV